MSEGKKIKYICKDCSKEFETTRDEAEKVFKQIGYVCCEECVQKETRKQGEEKLPVRQEPRKTPAKKKTDAELDAEIERGKAERFLSKRGSSYKVQGTERPDAHRIQNIANEKDISIEILEATQEADFSRVVVRAHLGEQFCDAVVNHDFETEYMLKTMEIISKNPEILDHWEGTEPVIKQGAKILIYDAQAKREVSKDAKYYIVHALLSFKKFSIRDARTKAAAIAEAMLLNRDWRDADEVQSELSEKALVEESIKNAKATQASKRTDDRFNDDYPGMK